MGDFVIGNVHQQPLSERVDLFNCGEPFLYRHLVDALRHIRQTLPTTTIAIATDGMQVHEPVESAIVRERLLDWYLTRYLKPFTALPGEPRQDGW